MDFFANSLPKLKLPTPASKSELDAVFCFFFCFFVNSASEPDADPTGGFFGDEPGACPAGSFFGDGFAFGGGGTDFVAGGTDVVAGAGGTDVVAGAGGGGGAGPDVVTGGAAGLTDL